MSIEKVTNKHANYWKYFFLVLLYTLFAIFYYVFRYDGYWSEWDSAYLTTVSDIVYQQGLIIPDGIKYNNGFGLQVLITFLVNLTGLSTHAVSQYLMPFLGVIIVIVAFPLFFEFTNDRKIALLATLLLVLSSDVFMQLVRTKHIKFFMILTIIALFCICKSFSNKSNRPIYVMIFYISMIGSIFFNTYYGSALTIILFISFIISELLKRTKRSSFSFSRLGITTASTIVFSFMNMFWVYTPSINFIYYMNSLKNRLITILFFSEPMTNPQYNYVMANWRPPELIFLLRLFDLIISPLSFILFLTIIYNIFKNNYRIGKSFLLLILFYTALGIMLVVAIIGDLSGSFASNMELGIYPIFMILIAPLASIGVFKIFEYVKNVDNTNRRYLEKTFSIFIIFLLLIFCTVSLVKITNDPIISNKWQFYTLQEKHGISWATSNLNSDSFWGGVDERLVNIKYQYPELYYSTRFKYASFDSAKTVLMSDTILKRVEVSNNPLQVSNISDSSIIYNAGQVDIYRR